MGCSRRRGDVGSGPGGHSWGRSGSSELLGLFPHFLVTLELDKGGLVFPFLPRGARRGVLESRRQRDKGRRRVPRVGVVGPGVGAVPLLIVGLQNRKLNVKAGTEFQRYGYQTSN